MLLIQPFFAYRHYGMDDRQGWRKCGKQVGTCSACRNPETKEGIHAAWMPPFPGGMTGLETFYSIINCQQTYILIN